MSWKDSPGIVAVVSGAAATAFVITVCFTVVIPTWLKSKEYEEGLSFICEITSPTFIPAFFAGPFGWI